MQSMSTRGREPIRLGQKIPPVFPRESLVQSVQMLRKWKSWDRPEISRNSDLVTKAWTRDFMSNAGR